LTPPARPSAERLADAARLSEESFWGTLSGLFPEVVYGDFDPLASHSFSTAIEEVVKSWVLGNWPEATFTFDEIEDTISGATTCEIHRALAGGSLSYKVELPDGRRLLVTDSDGPFGAGPVQVDRFAVGLYADEDSYANGESGPIWTCAGTLPALAELIRFAAADIKEGME
jgi:hypothetical protein